MKVGLNLYILVSRVLGVAFVMLVGSVHAQQTSRPADSRFSFDVYGDSRSMMYLPHKADQEAEARNLMVEMFELAVPRELAEGVVQKDVKLIYDPDTKELVRIIMPFMTASQVTTLKFDKGWVTEASVEDIKLLPGVSRTMYHAAGGEWVVFRRGKSEANRNSGSPRREGLRPRRTTQRGRNLSAAHPQAQSRISCRVVSLRNGTR